jgi:DNA-directed RNA polymerase specialized sigma24 family protein
MNELDQQLNRLIQKTCTCAQGSEDRQPHLDQLIRQLIESGRLWRRPHNIPETDYEEILQKSWIYLCGNLCEATTAAAPYDPQRASVLTWINAYIKMRVLNYYLEQEKERRRREPIRVLDDGTLINPIDLISSPPEPSPILQEILTWLEQESQRLEKVHLRDRPDIHCKALILYRLPPQEKPWKQLAQEFGVCESTLSGFYQRQCLPRLREAGEQFGFL